jgi:hypothetical protein
VSGLHDKEPSLSFDSNSIVIRLLRVAEGDSGEVR